MNWSRERPTVKGYYWYMGTGTEVYSDLHEADPQVTFVDRDSVYLIGSDVVFEIHEFKGRWQPVVAAEVYVCRHDVTKVGICMKCGEVIKERGKW